MLRIALRSSLASTFLLAACSDDVTEAMESDASSSDDGQDDDDDGPNTITVTSADTSSSEGGTESSGPSTVDTTAESSSSESTADSSSSDGESSSSSVGESESSSSSVGESSSSSVGESSSSTTDTSSCGDGVADADEVCDGDDVAGETCMSQLFDGGTLGCQIGCDAFDTSGCFSFSCGNDVIEGAEFCDGDDLAGADCLTLDFDGGTLACLRDCSAYDTSGCFSFSCGNDVIEGAEACDGIDLAGNTCLSLDFDGGVLGCAVDCTYDTSGCFFATCGNDLIEGAEPCDGTDLAGQDCITEGFDAGTLGCLDDCSALDTSGCVDFVCGDGGAQPPEQCDGGDLAGQTCPALGFVSGTLACNGDCTLDSAGCTPTFQEVEPNDDGMVATGTVDFSAAAANGPFSTDTFIHGAISPAGDDDFFAITNPSATYVSVRLETFGAAGLGTCASDTVVQVRTAANALVAENDDGGINACSLLTGVGLAPGETLYVRVIDFNDDGAITSYFLEVDMTPVVCSDGIVGPGEQCDDFNTDDGDGCSSTCQIEVVCGDGVVGPGERCDDLNTDDGDGCSSTCQIEGTTPEIEPNGTAAQADANGLVLVGDELFSAAIGAVGDIDVYRLELATDQVVRFETFSGIGVCSGISTTLRLRDAADTVIVSDSGAGISTCAALTFPLAAGTYYIQVEENGNNAAIPTYLLEVQTQADQGIETEPNEDLATASTNLQTAGSDVFVFGDHALNADSDFYAIDVAVAGSSLRLETIEGDRAVETCEGNGVDSRITLYNSLGAQLADDDDEGRGFCSIIDGTGTVGLDAGAHNLAAGTYYVQVRASSFSQANAAGQFIYRLVATVRTP